ncbi:uncharacterized protein CXorf58 homolog isoform X1 [Pantherophis guttatus]|uniref:Uncharacterized protein CXorf58 homolog isoform X1 n=1 Tax=Pantherophis guttatus TaxID=94885 RepID=A0ABM3ZNT7_PANGU|nr:uncharacterized protein CXorf58 homolog isoform X1 [Pantherophis guttatus]XP_060550037.1 uncharacterized protein CXorf58 homolog isoform X1 [Pantherophis guttatus]XP_060550038.1 uncharacterized protein CXorf58 homolog isoform X1 [Pantherophis guttatus]
MPTLSTFVYINIGDALKNVRQDQEIKGLRIKNEEYKVQTFANDMVFIVEEPLESGPKLIKKLEEFGEVARFKINKNKSKLITKNLTKKQEKDLEINTQIQVTKKIKYLGNWLIARGSSIKEDNYDKIVLQIKKDLDSWKNLQISLLGRIATIKMNILPKLLFLFQVIPIKLEKKFFETLNKIITKFVWQGKRPRIILKFLQDTKDRGGVALPEWELYYQAAGLTWLKEWIELKRILVIEGHDLQVGWHACLCDGKYKIHSYFKRHIVRNALLQMWLKIKKQHYAKIPIWFSPTDILNNPNLTELNTIIRYKDLIDQQGKLNSKQELELDLNRDIDWWIYIQIQSKYKKTQKHMKYKENIMNWIKLY